MDLPELQKIAERATPGTWDWSRDDYDNCAKSSAVFKSTRRPGDSCLNEAIAIIPHDDVCEDSEPEMLANGALVAAAPDLLDTAVALAKMLDMQAGACMNFGARPCCECLSCQARQLLSSINWPEGGA